MDVEVRSSRIEVCFNPQIDPTVVDIGMNLDVKTLISVIGAALYTDMIYLLTAIGLTPGGSSTVHIYTQTVHRTTQWKQSIQSGTYITIKIHNNRNT